MSSPVITAYKLPRKPEKTVLYNGKYYGFLSDHLIISSLPFKDIDSEIAEEDEDIDRFLEKVEKMDAYVASESEVSLAKDKFTRLDTFNAEVLTDGEVTLVKIPLKLDIGTIYYANYRIPVPEESIG